MNKPAAHVSSRRPPGPAAAAPDVEARLRMLDVALALVALAILALPLALARLVGQPLRLLRSGRGGARFLLRRLSFPAHALGRGLERIGAQRWPELFNVLRGELSWVGPAPEAASAPAGEPPLPVRPGLFSTWYVRSRTAVDFDGERAADAEDLARRGVRRHLSVTARALLVAILPAPPAEVPAQMRIGDVTLDNVDSDEALQRIERLVDGGHGALVCFANPACVNIAARHRGYRRVLGRAALVLPDGIGVKIACDLLGTPLRQNVNGTDLFPRLMDLLAARRTRVFLLGGQPGVPDRVAATIEQRWPQVCIAGRRDGYFRLAEEGAVVEAIRASGAEVLLVARGVPAQEVFVDRYGASLGVNLAIGVGGLFDFVSGRIPRAPLWMREIGAEWIYRLMQEPGRMWRRYLVGNVTFLARVLLQRWGMRRPREDAAPPRHGPAAGAAVRAAPAALRGVIVATQAAHAEIPVPHDEPAALLPVGPATLVERQVEQMAACGVREIDVVVCDAPERLRAVLGEGERWGVRLVWHLAKDPARPYGALRSSRFGPSCRILIAHADAWIRDDAVARLVAHDGVALHTDELGQRHWTGWASGPVRRFAEVPAHSDRADLRWLMVRAQTQRIELDARSCVTRLDAAGLLRLQALATDTAAFRGVPRSWIRTPWGACSPEARVHPEAHIEGPVLVGAGCIVERGARVGPNAWLSRDVVVSPDSHVRDAIVLPGTYIGTGLDLHGAIVNGRRVRSLRHGVETVMPADDGLLGSVRAPLRRRTGVLARAVAALALVSMAPIAALPSIAWRARRGTWPWTTQRAVVGRHADNAALEVAALLACSQPASRTARGLAAWVSLADVLRGRRAWFGVRPRTPSQWYALTADWQQMLARMPVGVLHEPAWCPDASQRLDAEAAADVYYATRAGWRENLRLAGAAWGAVVETTTLRRGRGVAAVLAGPSRQKVHGAAADAAHG